MQFTAVYIKIFLLPSWSINDICCWIPAWFGVLATLSTSALAYVCVSSVGTTHRTKSLLLDIPIVDFLTKNLLLPLKRMAERYLIKLTGSNWGIATQLNPPALESAVFTSLIMVSGSLHVASCFSKLQQKTQLHFIHMNSHSTYTRYTCFGENQAIVPAHLLRSVGGGYDNESVATTAMELTFWTWTLTLSMTNLTTTAIMGVVTGFMYFYMVAAWGGYVFVINLVGVHAFAVFLLRKLPFENIYTAYTSFYIVGTFLAMQVPVVGWTPLKSLEQLGPLGVFVGFQGLQLMKVLERKYSHVNKWKIRGAVALAGIVASLPVIAYLYSIGFFGPISSRVRGLFVKHTKTGNPLVDSVAEHQAASAQAYFQYLK
jgi:Oligosaccharyl transferase STT3 subunit